MVMLGVHLVFTVCSGLAWNFWSLAALHKSAACPQ
jgi:hypothetical protein